jgi:TonB family protein
MGRALLMAPIVVLLGTSGPPQNPAASPVGQLALRAALKSKSGELRPVQGAEFALTCEGPGAFSSQMCTDGEGSAFAYARPGKCHLKSLSPVRVGDKQYTWEGSLEFYRDKDTRLDLSDDNAQIENRPDSTSAAVPAVAGPTSPCGGEAVLPTAGMVLPVLVEKIFAEYPPDPRAKKLPGKVICQAVVGTDGFVRDIKVLSSSDAIFNAPAVRALARWRYIPAQLNGKAVAVYYTVRTDFNAR